MQKRYHLRFDLKPVQQARPRARRTKFGVQLYDPIKVKKFKQELGLLAKQQWHQEPLEGALRVTINFYRDVQKSISKRERGLRLSGAHRPTVKPDIDNYIKSALDGLNGVIWIDDNQIVSLHSDKFYSEEPRIDLIIEKLEENDDN